LRCEYHWIAQYGFFGRICDDPCFDKNGGPSRCGKDQQIVVREYSVLPIHHRAVFTKNRVHMVMRWLESGSQQLIRDQACTPDTPREIRITLRHPK
jgi:hypothetical protein